MCGETDQERLNTELARGLSPRVRGNLLQNLLKVQGRRSIPACAGKPMSREMSVIVAPVYPRVCGETLGR